MYVSCGWGGEAPPKQTKYTARFKPEISKIVLLPVLNTGMTYTDPAYNRGPWLPVSDTFVAAVGSPFSLPFHVFLFTGKNRSFSFSFVSALFMKYPPFYALPENAVQIHCLSTQASYIVPGTPFRIMVEHSSASPQTCTYSRPYYHLRLEF